MATEYSQLYFYRNNLLSTSLNPTGHICVVSAHNTPAAETTFSGTSTMTRLYHVDGLRTLQGVNRTTPLNYTAFGFSPRSAVGCPLLGFTGQLHDRATNLYILGNGRRAYSPILMRFHSPDRLSPFGKGGINTYAYCGGDPINFSDPSGLFRKWFRKQFRRLTGQTKAFNKGETAGFKRGKPAGVAEGLEVGRAEGEIIGLEKGEIIGFKKGEISGFKKGKAAGVAKGSASARKEMSSKTLTQLQKEVQLRERTADQTVQQAFNNAVNGQAPFQSLRADDGTNLQLRQIYGMSMVGQGHSHYRGNRPNVFYYIDEINGVRGNVIETPDWLYLD
ncbi:hypothetical protein CCOS865_04264 [Pseudomonas reidholzensis]|uniref:RHS repeat-associated core domain-containing protein n=1 Tax=Pseudomonas reidholzensis TaxID=1785162 RepID=A0A383RZB4_9PSED|nr:RHS repeat-associated core domain-containing protein [Pseudomonas reidholzensis]SYX91984.1 hypothetical protein CCOS865_04264 [Pseudomonas reidholzensis]